MPLGKLASMCGEIRPPWYIIENSRSDHETGNQFEGASQVVIMALA